MPGEFWAFSSGVGACVRAVCGLGQVWSPAVPQCHRARPRCRLHDFLEEHVKKKVAGRSARAVVEPSFSPVSYLWRLSRLLPVVLLLVGIVFQFLTPVRLNGSPFFVAAPLIAAPVFSLGRTVAFGVAAFVSAATLRFVADIRERTPSCRAWRRSSPRSPSPRPSPRW